ncbi:class I SAM-dependent methyltransferase [Mesorhizobium sp.]|uniref:class I SAM-dependent methyltransferase n=1 Tax=Mesorhizobium sp. TaxID=1871066 RepID=UPI000FE7CBC1|nr:class I SAM-dependent methyltransferase [Mesorhizobium sp.]RWA97446.1 MAG: class I SAM-dependent methyltransferase [Mesorhizobium sp.]
MEKEQIEHEISLAAFNQNSEHFRSLNSLMWQVPLIAMTLTGGLWYGVSTSQSSQLIQVCLLLLASGGNLGLFIALSRIRFIMGRYLKWFEEKYPAGYVKAEGDGRFRGDGLFTGRKVVQRVFQTVLIAASCISFGLIVATAMEVYSTYKVRTVPSSYYDKHAEELADAYESISFDRAHPELFKALSARAPVRVLDVGSGTGRDAAWADQAGHYVIAVEPAAKMLNLAKTLHTSTGVTWVLDSLPELKKVGDQKFDLIILSAVWMHIPPAERADALRRLSQLLDANGLVYLTLRVGPPDEQRGFFSVTLDELKTLTASAGLSTTLWSTAPDLLSRPDIKWQRIAMVRAGEKSPLLESAP